jgi:uncharacterized membrane protein
MTKDAFLDGLKRGLAGLPAAEVAEIVADYAAHFAESQAHGRSEAEVAAALGDPARIARELRADIGLRRFESDRSLSNLAAAVMALAALAFVDIFFLLPLLILATIVAAGFGIGLFAIGVAGLKIILSALFHANGNLMGVFARLCVGAGLLSAFIGCGALLLMGFGAGIRTLGHYARLHFRLARPARHDA